MALWTESFRPKTGNELLYNKEVYERLVRAANVDGSLPHLCFYGASGSGRVTIAYTVLRAIFGPAIDKLTRRAITIKNSDEPFRIVRSLHHIQLSVSDLGNRDKLCIQHAVKEIAQISSFQLDTTISTRDDQSIPEKSSLPNYRVILLCDAECLSLDAQAALRRTLETSVVSTRVIFITTKISSIIEPLQSRCLCVRVPAPSKDQMRVVLKEIIDAVGNINVKDDQLDSIINSSNRNMRRAILKLQMYSSNRSRSCLITPLDKRSEEIASHILSQPTPATFLATRKDLYALLSAPIPPAVILRSLCDSLMQKCGSNESMNLAIVKAAAYYAANLSTGKPIFHLEAFVARVIAAVAAAKQ